MTNDFKWARLTILFSTLLSAAGCSNSGGSAASNPGGDAGPSGSGGASSIDSGKGTGGSNATSVAVRTSAACGSVPITGDYGPATPSACAACVESSCCAEAKACADDPTCSAFRDCAGSCRVGDSPCVRACLSAHSPGATNGAFNTCRIGKCASCLDTSCVGEAPPAPTEATATVTWHLYNFASGAAVAGLSVKVCAFEDADCATPLDSGTTDANGEVTVDMPQAPTWTTAYLEITGPSIQSQINFPRGRGALGPLMAFPVLDTATSAAFLTLAGGSQPPDGGAFTVGSMAQQGLSCANQSLSGVTFTTSNGGPDVVTSYIEGGVPSTSATATNGTGIGALVNHAPGMTTVSMQLAATGQTLGSVEVFVRAGWYTTCSVPVGQ